MSLRANAVRDLLRARFPDALPVSYQVAEAVATGLPVLDRVLPGGGLPRGRLSVWEGGGGATAVLRSACLEAARRGERAAWVDAAGVVVGEMWPWRVGPDGSRGVGEGGGVELVRPAGEWAGLECAEELLRSGGYALVVLTGAGKSGTTPNPSGGNGPVMDPMETNGPDRDSWPGDENRPAPRRSNPEASGGNDPEREHPTPGNRRAVRNGPGWKPAGHAVGGKVGGMPGVRLSRAAREGGGAFVWVGGESPVAGLRFRSRIGPADYRWIRDPFGEPTEVEAVKVRVSVRGLGLGREVEFWLPVLGSHVRLSLEPELVDRRGAGV